jgi:polysaccharide biosynthesis transport protein
MQQSPPSWDNVERPWVRFPGLMARHFLRTAWRKWWLPVIGAILFAGMAMAWGRAQTVQYVTRATMWVRGNLRVEELGQYTEDLQNFFGTQIQLLQSDKMRERANQRLRATRPDVAEARDALNHLSIPKLRVTQAPKSSVFVLECSSGSADYARAYLDALMDEFLAYKKEVRAQAFGDALASVSAQVSRQETALRQEQEQLLRFCQSNNVPLLEENLRSGSEQLAHLNSQIAMLKLDLQILTAEAVEEKPRAPRAPAAHAYLATADRVTGLNPPPSEPAAAPAMHQQLQALKLQREQWGRVMRPQHPKIIKLTEEIERVEKLIDFCRAEDRGQVLAACEGAELRIRTMETAAAALRGKVSEANRLVTELDRIKASVSRQQSFHERLLALLQGVDLNTGVSHENVSILERAGPARRQHPADFSTVGTAGFSGLLVGLGLVLLVARLDDRCHSLAHVRAYFTEELYGQVPEVETRHTNGRVPVLGLDKTPLPFAEACRHLRSSLLFGQPEAERSRTILVASASPEEGKTTIALSVAAALALGGARVLLVDGDLRRGRLHEITGTAEEPGLSGSLRQTGDLEIPVQSTPLSNLLLLPRGKASPDAGDLFLTPHFEALMSSARQQYDYVVVDSYPVLAADDTVTLASKTDGVLFVLRCANTPGRLAREAMDLLRQRQASILGLVFNCAGRASDLCG